jgi:hypothetical protein
MLPLCAQGWLSWKQFVGSCRIAEISLPPVTYICFLLFVRQPSKHCPQPSILLVGSTFFLLYGALLSYQPLLLFNVELRPGCDRALHVRVPLPITSVHGQCQPSFAELHWAIYYSPSLPSLAGEHRVRIRPDRSQSPTSLQAKEAGNASQHLAACCILHVSRF